MKQRIFILPLLLGPVSAMAFDLHVYYDTNGNCDTFCSIQHQGEGCCPTQNVVTSEAIAEKFMDIANNRDEVFSGFTLPDGTVLMDSTGDLKLTGRQVNAKGLDSTVTLRTTNTCAQGGKNTNGVCVDVQAFEGENVAYVDWTSVLNNTNGDSGYEIDASQIKDNGGKDCYYDRDFDIVIHWCPKNYSAIDYSYGGAHIAYGNNPVDWSALPCNQSTETYHYHWNGGTSLGTYTKNNVTQTEIVFPSATGWSPRGLYIVGYPEFKPNDNSFNNIPYYSLLKTIADNFVTEQSTTWGRARLGLPFNQLGVTDRIILNNKVNGYGDANANWQIWTCNGDIETVHMYAAWARNPIVDTTNVGGEFKIYRTGLSNPDKGDAEYRYWCQESGATLNNAGAYNASCDLGKCSLDNLPGCTTLEACTDISGAHWCFSGSTPSCMSSASGRSMCCNDNLDACTKESACTDVGGTWNGTSCVASSNSGGGNSGGTGGDIGGTYKCPVNIYTPTASQHITVSGPSQSAGTCTYTVSCADGYTNLTGGNATVTCNDQQSCNALSFEGYSCTAQTPMVTCPSVATLQSGAPDGITVTAGTHTTMQCKYTLTCPTNYTLNGPNSNGQITCTGSNCASVIDNYSCVAPEPTFSCPLKSDFAGMLPNHMLISEPTSLSGNKCKYTLSCQGSDYSLNPSSPNTVTCTESQCTEAGVLALIENTYTCQANPTFTCPDPHDLQKPDVMTMSRPTLDSSTQTCTYDLGCISGYAIPIAPPYGSSSQTISCTGDQCRDGQYLQSLIDDRQNHPFTRCGKVWSTEACSATYAEGANAAGTITTYWNSSDYNGTLCILNGTCDKLHCNPGTLGDKYCDGSMRLCGAGGGSESVTENCLELVQNYANVSCSNDCPSLAKVNEFVLGNIEYAYAFTDTNHLGNQCAYLLECESGYTPSISYATCSKTNGCKLGSSDWVFPTCVYDYGY